MFEIVSEIVKFYKKNKRDMPWRHTTDAYKIWLSEIILQQTQVIQGLAYYNRFIENFPTVIDLAEAKEEEVLKLWQGLGYYSRARNLHKAAQIIKSNYHGEFPNTYQSIIDLPGIGEYTAAAICSFAYNLPYPALDGNVYRFISRLYAIEFPINEQKNRKVFIDILNTLISNADPRLFNNAMMEIGATICKPQNPNCGVCPVSINCIAFKNNTVSKFPIKTGNVKVRIRHLNFLHINYNSMFYLSKRIEKDIWQNLFTLPLIESESIISREEIIDRLPTIIKNKKYSLNLKLETKHLLTHQILYAKFWVLKLDQSPDFKGDNFIQVDINSYKNFAIPKLIDKYLLLL
jgi:A/G-specific adenine glycosylase